MSSERAGIARPRVRCALHSIAFFWVARLFAGVLVLEAGRIVRNEVFASPQVHAPFWAVVRVSVLLLLAWFVWFRGKKVFATDVGIELRLGRSVQLIPWEQVVDLREMPWMTLHPPWYPKLYQLDLADGRSFDFVGQRTARAIMVALGGGG